MKILVIGCGSIGQRHIRNLISIKAGLILAFDIDEKKLKEVQEISSSIKVFSILNKAWKEKPQAAFITIPTALHIKYAVEAAKKGCHLFIEKPLSHNTGRLNSLVKITKNAGLITFIGYNFRFNNCLLKIKELIKNKAIGNIIDGRCHFGSYLPERHPREDYRAGYGARKDLGGGAILDALSHQMDYLIFLFGKPSTVFCYSNKSSDLDIDVEDTVESLVKFQAGQMISLHADFIQRPYKHTFELIGENGTIFCDFMNNFLRFYNIKARRWVRYKGDKDPNKIYIKEIKYFMRCIQEGILPPVDLHEGIKEVRLLMNFKKSACTKRLVKL